VKPSINVEKPTEKYLEIFTEDNFEFWFMGFLKYQKTITYLHQAISQAKATPIVAKDTTLSLNISSCQHIQI